MNTQKPTTQSRSAVISTRLDRELAERFEAELSRSNLSSAQIQKIAVAQYLDRVETRNVMSELAIAANEMAATVSIIPVIASRLSEIERLLATTAKQVDAINEMLGGDQDE